MKKIKHIVFLLIGVIISINGFSQEAIPEQTLKNSTDSLSYCFGILIGNNMAVQGVQELNEEMFMKGFDHGYSNAAPVISMETANQYIQEYFNKQIENEANMNLERSKLFMAENAKQEGVVTLPSGLQYKIITPGSGDHPLSTDQVKVHYHGTFIDGKVFDSSIERGEPIVFGVNEVIPGWTEALQLMQPGARWMLFIPSDLAYGSQGAGGVIGPNQALVFEVELIEIVR